MPASTEDTRKGGGGNATASGILYQGGVGALSAAHLLTEMQVGNVFGLANARIKAIRFETSAPVDDILIETDQGGFVAIQAKATVSMGSTLSSVLGSVADQFVRHWIATKRSAGSEPWARPLDPSRDRLVLVYGPGSGGTVARLAHALHGVRPDGPAGKLRDAFEDLIRTAFAANGETPTDEDVAGLIDCIDLLELDPAGRDRALAERIQSRLVVGPYRSSSFAKVAASLVAELSSLTTLDRKALSKQGLGRREFVMDRIGVTGSQGSVILAMVLLDAKAWIDICINATLAGETVTERFTLNSYTARDRNFPNHRASPSISGRALVRTSMFLRRHLAMDRHHEERTCGFEDTNAGRAMVDAARKQFQRLRPDNAIAALVHDPALWFA